MKVSKEVEQAIEKARMEGRVTERPEVHAEDSSEKDFQAEVIKFAERRGWHHYHVFFSQRSNPGFPDLVLWRDRVVFMELKAIGGKLTADQMRVIDELRHAKSEVYVFRPSDWKGIESVLE